MALAESTARADIYRRFIISFRLSGTTFSMMSDAPWAGLMVKEN
jgi:hypothetical protein